MRCSKPAAISSRIKVNRSVGEGIRLAGALTVTAAQGPDYIGQRLSRWALANVPEATVFL
jgi:hypothetical protein